MEKAVAGLAYHLTALVHPCGVRAGSMLKAARVQELNRQKSGFASTGVVASSAAHVAWLDEQIEAVTGAMLETG